MMRRQQVEVEGVHLRVLRTDQVGVYRDIARAPEEFRKSPVGKQIEAGAVCKLKNGNQKALASFEESAIGRTKQRSGSMQS